MKLSKLIIATLITTSCIANAFPTRDISALENVSQPRNAAMLVGYALSEDENVAKNVKCKTPEQHQDIAFSAIKDVLAANYAGSYKPPLLEVVHNALFKSYGAAIRKKQCVANTPRDPQATFTLSDIHYGLKSESEQEFFVAIGYIIAAHDRFVLTKCKDESTIPDVGTLIRGVTAFLEKAVQNDGANMPANEGLRVLFETTNLENSCLKGTT